MPELYKSAKRVSDACLLGDVTPWSVPGLTGLTGLCLWTDWSACTLCPTTAGARVAEERV